MYIAKCNVHVSALCLRHYMTLYDTCMLSYSSMLIWWRVVLVWVARKQWYGHNCICESVSMASVSKKCAMEFLCNVCLPCMCCTITLLCNVESYVHASYVELPDCEYILLYTSLLYTTKAYIYNSIQLPRRGLYARDIRNKFPMYKWLLHVSKYCNADIETLY